MRSTLCRVWDADKQEALVEGVKAFGHPTSCITTDEYSRCWVGGGALAGWLAGWLGTWISSRLGAEQCSVQWDYLLLWGSLTMAAQGGTWLQLPPNCCALPPPAAAAGADRGRVRSFRLEPTQRDGVNFGYRLVLRGELNTVGEGIPEPDYNNPGAGPRLAGEPSMQTGGGGGGGAAPAAAQSLPLPRGQPAAAPASAPAAGQWAAARGHGGHGTAAGRHCSPPPCRLCSPPPCRPASPPAPPVHACLPA